jgi:hypothetical protein
MELLALADAYETRFPMIGANRDGAR